MRVIYLPTLWTVIIDVLAWFVIHVGVVFIVLRIPGDHFNPESWLYKCRGWEEGSRFYDKIIKIKKWKGALPDGARFSKNRGFVKKRLKSRDAEHLNAFFLETCRAEFAHWVLILFAPLFFLWNRPWVGFFMVFYALMENGPLILAQRYNRIRLRRVLEKER